MIQRVSGTPAASRAFGVSAPKLRAASSTRQPDAPVTGIGGALGRGTSKPAARSPVGSALTQLASAKAFGPDFSFVKMDEPTALRAAHAGLAAINAVVGSSGTPTLHGFAPHTAFRDELGRVNVRYTRTYDGVPLFGYEVIAHLDDDRVVDLTGSALPADLHLDTKPRISASQALATARAAFAATPERTSEPRLTAIATAAGVYHLAYHVAVAAYGGAKGPRRVHYFVDAHSGELLRELTYADHLGVRADVSARAATKAPTDPTPAPVPQEGSGNSLYSGQVKLTTTKVGDSYVLRDPTKHDAETRDAHNQGESGALRQDVFTDDNNTWAEPSDSPRALHAVDAQYGATHYLRYLKDFFGRDSLDDKGRQLISLVHVGNNFGDAYWDGQAMHYGDGDGGDFLAAVDTDTCGHEVTHGVTESSSGLVYRGESGALNEAGSDILGACGFSWFLRGMKDKGILKDYLLFEDSYTANIPDDAIRYMHEPTKDGKSKDNYTTRYRGPGDNGGVHRNSGIANNFFYLLSAGGVNKTSGIKVEPGIGMEKALRIYYRAHTVYFTPNTTFAQARVAWVKAATDLFGAASPEVATVKQAATAVGIDATGEGSLQLIS